MAHCSTPIHGFCGYPPPPHCVLDTTNIPRKRPRLIQNLVQVGFTEEQPILEVDADLTNGTLAEEVMAGVRDETHPLVTLLETTPHAMSLLIKPWNYHPDTMVRSPDFLEPQMIAAG